MKKIRGYWLVAQMGGWREIYQEQWDALDKSGLYAATDELTVIVLGTEPVMAGKAKVIYHPKGVGLFEFPALQQMWSDSQWDQFNCYYLHSKGASWSENSYSSFWRHYMQDTIIGRWRLCLSFLSDFRAVGVEFRTKPNWHFAGNFFWTDSDQLKVRTYPVWQGNRGAAEMWLLENWPRVCCLHNECKPLYNHKPSNDVWMEYPDILGRVFACGSDDLQNFGGTHQGGYFLQQRPEEIATILFYLRAYATATTAFNFDNVLEIGAASGGLSRLFRDEYDCDNWVIDWDKHPAAYLRSSILPSAKEFSGDSHTVEAKKWLLDQPKMDLVIIDGDHSEEGVSADAELAMACVHSRSLLLFHDHIAVPEVNRAVEKLREDQRLKLKYQVGDNVAGALGITVFEVL